MTPLQGALDLAERGFHLHPLDQKRPLLSDWPDLATRDAAQLRAWSEQYPGCGFGIVPGKSGHFVLDLDRKGGRDGVAELEKLQAELAIELPNTLSVATANGGVHVYLAGNSRNAVNLRPGLDVRGDNGFVVAPGSVVDGREYRIIGDVDAWETIPDAPPALLALLNERKAEARAGAANLIADAPVNEGRAAAFLRSASPAVEYHGGNETTYKAAEALRDLGLSEGAALDAMAEHYNSRCEPPWSDDDLAQIVRNAFAYGQNESGCDAVLPADMRLSPEILAELVESAPTVEQKRGRFEPIWAKSFHTLPTPSYLVDKIIPAKALTAIYSPPAEFKTFVALDIAASVAAGIPALGKFRTERGDASYAAGEAPFGIARVRMPAWALARGIEMDPLRFAITPAVPLVQDPAQVEAFMEAVERSGLKPSLVAIDTVARAMGGLDENDARSAGLMVTASERIMAAWDCSVVLIAHTGKDTAKGVRGSSALFAAVDACWRVSRTKETLAVTLSCEKMKDADPPPDIHLQGQNAAGSLVFNAISADEYAALSRTVPPLSQADVQKALRAAGAVAGATIPTRQLAASLVAGEGGDPKAAQAMERRLRRAAEKHLAAYVVEGGGSLKWTFPDAEHAGGTHA